VAKARPDPGGAELVKVVDDAIGKIRASTDTPTLVSLKEFKPSASAQ